MSAISGNRSVSHCLLAWTVVFVFTLASRPDDVEQQKLKAQEHIKNSSASKNGNSAQARPISDNYATLAAHFMADNFHKRLRSNVNELLGVPVMQSIVDSQSFTQVLINESLLKGIANRLDTAFAKYSNFLREIHKFVGESSQPTLAALREYQCFMECSRLHSAQLSYEEQFGKRVNLSTACILSSKQPTKMSYYPNKNLTSALHANALDSAVRWQYVFGLSGPHIEYPAHIIPVHKRRHWSSFVATALPFKRRIVILLDTGSLLNEAQVVKSKGIARIILDCATPDDRLAVMVATGLVINRVCTSQNFLSTTRDQIAQMITFIDGIEKGDQKNYSHSEAIQAAFALFAKEESETIDSGGAHYDNILFYVSRGVLSELSETTSVLSGIAEILLKTNVRVKINTIALSEGEKTPSMWSVEFLRNIAEQNFTRYRQSFSEKIKHFLNTLPSVKGKMVLINTNEYMVLDLLRMYDLLKRNFTVENKFELRWSYPFVENHASLISISSALWKDKNFVAIVGMDLNIDVIADVIKYNDLILMMPKKSLTKAFLCDLKGRVIIDSSNRKSALWPVHIGVIEAWATEDLWVSDYFATKDIGEGTFEIESIKNDKSVKLNYLWMRLKNAPFVVVLAYEAKANPKVSLLMKNSRQEYALDNLIYHRLDIQRDSAVPYCAHFGQLSTSKLGGVYLSPSCFTISSIQRPPSPQWIANYWVYLGDPFGLIRNTGIRSGVREHVGALSGIIPYWRDKVVGADNEYVLRRYVATPRGVMITYPATVVRDNYEPDMEPWYTKAVNMPGRIVVTGTYLEDQVGQIVTLSTAIFEGHSSSLHDPDEDQVFAVIAMDVSVEFFAKLLRNGVSGCKETQRCVIFDDLGNVIVRGGVDSGFASKFSSANSNSRGRSWNGEAVERFHLSSLEPELVTQLITHSSFVRKRLCVHWSTRSIERLFHFNMTFSNVLTVPCEDGTSSLSSKPENLRAEVIPIPQTNLFFALINKRCSPSHPIHAFCPCSVSDRRCLLCSRFDASECECPCQCPLDSNSYCPSRPSNESFRQVNAIDENFPKTFEECSSSFTATSFVSRSVQKIVLTECKEIRCEKFKILDECLGIVGCQWCSLESDGQTALQAPFCSPVDLCFTGTKGRRIRGFLLAESQLTPQWSVGAPVGPVAAGIMSVFLMMVMAVYCYRSQVSRLVDGASSADSYGAPLCGRWTEDDDFQFDHDGLNGPNVMINVTPIQLTSFEKTFNPPATSVRPKYRASPRTESSDHGYSTMTDRVLGDESEGATSSVNIARQSGKALLTTICANEDNCSSVVTTEADVHQMPRALLIS